MNCLSKDSLIFTKDGLKKITEVKTGEIVYAFDQKTHKLVLKKCSGVFDNGTKPVYEIETFHHNIKATTNHPFLIVNRNGRGKENELIWKTLEDLKKGDQVITLKKLEGDKSYSFNKIKLAQKGKNKANNLNEISIPSKSNDDLMLFLGLWVGDGWIREQKGEVGFALPEKTEGRKELIRILQNTFKHKAIRTDKVYVYSNSINLANFINSLGFNKGAKTKTLPSWIFTIPDKEKKAFIKGLMLSDGYIYKKIKDSCRYVSASKDLIIKLRLLLQTLDYRVGKITTQKKLKGTKVVYRELLRDSEYYSICFSEKDSWNIDKYPSQYKYQKLLIGNKNFDVEIIKSIKFVGKEPTLDLRVEGEHNFIADGIVVHNTGNQRSSATPMGASTSTTPSGKIVDGKKEFQKDLAKIAIAHNIPYVATINPADLGDMHDKVKKAFEKKGPSVLIAFAACPTNMKAPSDQTISISKLAIETNSYPLYEYEDGKYKINYKPEKREPVENFLKTQTKFNAVLKNKAEIKKIQEYVDKEWKELLLKEKISNLK
ncbi:MAG: LAGLIDADG family homing endonuclease [archaeon]